MSSGGSLSFSKFNLPIGLPASAIGVTGTGSTGALGSMVANFNFVQTSTQVTISMNTTTPATVTAATAGTYTFPAGTVPANMVPTLTQTLIVLVSAAGLPITGSVEVTPTGELIFGLVPTTATWPIGAAGTAITSVTYNQTVTA